jgi:transposase InsO family protein
MKLHGNAALSWQGRRRLVQRVVSEGWTLTAAAEAAGVSVRCARKWVGRYRLEGELGLHDRSSAPRRVANRTAPELGLEPALRYERARPGELVHVDVKKLGRIQGGAGWRVRGGRQHYNPRYTDQAGNVRHTVGYEYVHIAVDDHSRLAYAEVLADEKATTAVAFLRRALAFYRRYGIRVERVLSDNGSAYRSAVHALACRRLGIKHLRTRPYRPQTNGKAERFIRTLLAGWAHGAIYGSSTERTAALDGWLWHYG